MPTSQTISHHDSENDLTNGSSLEMNDLTQRSGTSDSTGTNNTLSTHSANSTVYHKYHLDPPHVEPEWFQRIAIPPWAEHPIPSEKLQTLPVLLEWVLHLWHIDYISTNPFIQRMYQLGSHPETFIRPHPMFSHRMHNQHQPLQRGNYIEPSSHGGNGSTELMSSSERNARIRGFLLYDSRTKRWHQKLTPQQVDNFAFFYNLATHCQAILQGHPAYLQNPMYMSTPTWLDQAPDSTHGKQRLHAAYNAMQKVVLKELGIERQSSAVNSRSAKRRSLLHHGVSPPGSTNHLTAMVERAATASLNSISPHPASSHSEADPHSLTVRNNHPPTARPPLHRSNSIPLRHHHDVLYDTTINDKPSNARRHSASQRNSKSLHVARQTDGEDDLRSPSPVPLNMISFEEPSDSESAAQSLPTNDDTVTFNELQDQVDHQMELGALSRRQSHVMAADDEIPPDLLRSLPHTDTTSKHRSVLSTFAMPSPQAHKPTKKRRSLGEVLDNISATQKHMLDALAVTAVIGYFLVTPWVLFCVFYGGILTTLESGAVAWILPNLVQIISYYRLRKIQGIMSMASDKSFFQLIRDSSYRQLTQRLYQWIWLTTGK